MHPAVITARKLLQVELPSCQHCSIMSAHLVMQLGEVVVGRRTARVHDVGARWGAEGSACAEPIANHCNTARLRQVACCIPAAAESASLRHDVCDPSAVLAAMARLLLDGPAFLLYWGALRDPGALRQAPHAVTTTQLEKLGMSRLTIEFL